VKALYDDISGELELGSPYDPGSTLGTNQTFAYSFNRALLQSTRGGRHVFVTEGTLARQVVKTPQGAQTGIQDERTFEGWKHFNA
jgi:hypothetical protein